MTFDPRFLQALLNAYIAFASSRPHERDGVHAYLFLTLSSAYLVVVDVSPDPAAASSTQMSDLVSPFLALSPSWIDISRMPLAVINSMHDEGNAAGRWYIRSHNPLNSPIIRITFLF
jgi:hypothetical protein